MDEARFWQIVGEGGPAADERAAFATQWQRHLDLANTRPLRDAATLLLGWPNDAEFLDFRRWLITRGRDTYLAALREPDTLADATVTPSGVDAGDLEAGWVDGEPTGEWTNLGDRHALRAAFPGLAARYEGGCR